MSAPSGYKTQITKEWGCDQTASLVKLSDTPGEIFFNPGYCCRRSIGGDQTGATGVELMPHEQCECKAKLRKHTLYTGEELQAVSAYLDGGSELPA